MVHEVGIGLPLSRNGHNAFLVDLARIVEVAGVLAALVDGAEHPDHFVAAFANDRRPG
jgi:hypothetical protein